MAALEAMSDSDEDEVPESQWNTKAKNLRQAIEDGQFDHLIEAMKKSNEDDDDDESEIEEVILNSDSSDEDEDEEEEPTSTKKDEEAVEEEESDEDDEAGLEGLEAVAEAELQPPTFVGGTADQNCLDRFRTATISQLPSVRLLGRGHKKTGPADPAQSRVNHRRRIYRRLVKVLL